MSASYGWERHYESAILETDFSRVEGLIKTAQAAIDERRAELRLDPNASTEEEHAIADALVALDILQKEVTRYLRDVQLRAAKQN